MERQQQEAIRQRLEKMAATTRSRIESLEEGGLAESQRDAVAELSSYDNHPADLGSEVFERSKDLALRDLAQLQLQQIEGALARLEDGSFGFCQRCGRPIDPERLQALPQATLCRQCREAVELEAGDRESRPIEEEVLLPPFGGYQGEAGPSYRDHRDGSGYDGEDAWQDVARYGTSETPSDLPNTRTYPQVYWDADEDRGSVQEVEGLPVEIDEDGVPWGVIYGVDSEERAEEQ